MSQQARGFVRISIPGIPPSVNHYKKPIKVWTPNGEKTSFALTPEAQDWIQLTQVYRLGQTLIPEDRKAWNKTRYVVYVTIFLGKGDRGDGDNFWKCVADSLVKAGVIHSDARIRRWILDVDDEQRENGPRTLIRAAVWRQRSNARSTAERSGGKARKEASQ